MPTPRKRQRYVKDVVNGLISHAEHGTSVAPSDRAYLDAAMHEADSRQREVIRFLLTVIEEKREFTTRMKTWARETALW